MTRRKIPSLLWKEWREHLPLVLVLSPVLGILLVWLARVNPDYAESVAIFAHVFIAIVIPILCAFLLPFERGTGRLRMLMSRPVDLRWILLAKTIVVMAACIGFAMIVTIAVEFLLAGKGELRIADSVQWTPFQVITYTLLFAFSTFAWAMLASSRAESESSAASRMVLVFLIVWLGPLLLALIAGAIMFGPDAKNTAQLVSIANRLQPMGILGDDFAPDHRISWSALLQLPIGIAVWFWTFRRITNPAVRPTLKSEQKISTVADARLLTPASPLRAMFHKEWRCVGPLVKIGVVGYGLIVALDLATSGFHRGTGRSMTAVLDSMGMIAMFVVPLLAVFLPVISHSADSEPAVRTMIYSRPVDARKWFLVRVLLPGALVFIPAATLLSVWVGMDAWEFLSLPPELQFRFPIGWEVAAAVSVWPLLYCASFLWASLARNTFVASLLAIATLGVVTIILSTLQFTMVAGRGQLSWSLAPESVKIQHALQSLVFISICLFVTAILLIACRAVAVRQWPTEVAAR